MTWGKNEYSAWTRWTSTSFAVVVVLAGCGGTSCPEPSIPSDTEVAESAGGESEITPTLRGTYVIERVVGSDGDAVSVDTLIEQLQLAGARWSLVFAGEAMGPELIMVFNEGVETTADGSRRHVFTVSSCSALQTVRWISPDRFEVPTRLETIGVAEVVYVDQRVEDDGGEVTETDTMRDRCSASLAASELTIVERGPAGNDGRPRTVILVDDEGTRYELFASVAMDDIDLTTFVREIAAEDEAPPPSAEAPSASE